MPHHKSAAKRLKQNHARMICNRARQNRIRTFFKKVELALQEKDYDLARLAFRRAQPEIDRGVTKGLMHRNTAARKLSRLSARIKTLRPSTPS